MSKFKDNIIRRKTEKDSSVLDKDHKEKYLIVFFAAAVIMLVIMLPLIIYNGGYFLYYGDFNSQQIPFYKHVHDAIADGGLFGWDWGTDLGSPLFTSYSFYNTGSPFFWITELFPESITISLIPFLLAVKTGVAALTSYAYMRRFLSNTNACFIGAMLYAFSGFQAYNVFFNHFHDAVAFFPLLLLALEMNVQDNKRGVFGLCVALCGVVNYYFFISEVVFVIIYFIIRCTDKNFNITIHKFLKLAFEAVVGTFIACIVLVPSYYSICENPRVDEYLTGTDMIVYSDKFRILRIIQSFFMMPDPPARVNLLNSETARWASIAGYLPMFSMAGVVAFMRAKKRNWMKTLITVSIIFAFVPVLNAAFQLFKGTYYARWFFMPILIMCLMTAYVFDDDNSSSDEPVDLKRGIPAVAIVLIASLAVFFLPVTDDNGNYQFFKIAEYPELFYIQIVVSAALFAELIVVVYHFKRNKKYVRTVSFVTCLACAISMMSTMYYGIAQGPDPDTYISRAIKGTENIELPSYDEAGFYRIETSENTDNWPMLWGYSTIRAFNSTVSTSIMKFYDMLGIERNVASRPEKTFYALRSLLSVKYYFDEASNEKSSSSEVQSEYLFGINRFSNLGSDNENAVNKDTLNMRGFNYINSQNGFNVYENKYYIPMGFAYDTYLTYDEFSELSTENKTRNLISSLVINDEQIEKYKDILTHYNINEYNGDSTYMEACNDKKTKACSEFKPDNCGFSAKINLSKKSIVFFSVPYDKGFSATVNGKKAEIEVVDGGLMAVVCDEGDNKIRFDFELYGLRQGMAISLTGIVILAGYVLVCKRLSRTKRVREKVKSIDFYED